MTKSTERPKKPPVKSDKQLKTTELIHNMWMGIIVKWCVAILFMSGLFAIVVLVTIYVVQHQDYIKIIADQVFENMGSIIVAIAVFLGLKTFPVSKDS